MTADQIATLKAIVGQIRGSTARGLPVAFDVDAADAIAEILAGIAARAETAPSATPGPAGGIAAGGVVGPYRHPTCDKHQRPLRLTGGSMWTCLDCNAEILDRMTAAARTIEISAAREAPADERL